MISLFSKKSIAAAALVLSLLLAAGCSKNPDKAVANLNAAAGTASENTTSQSKNDGSSADSTNKSSQASANNSGVTTSKKQSSSNSSVKDTVNSEQSVTEKVKNYIINGQESKPEAQKIKWSKTFLNRVDIESLYKKYKANGGNADDIESFAGYITQNAPIPSDWQELFKKDLYDTYGEKVSRLEHLKDDLYQAYVVKDGSEVPYVVVSSRTGYFHG